MSPVLLLLLVSLNPESMSALPDNTTGQKFFVVFPENIAYFHPTPPQNKVRITALYDRTVVSVTQYTYNYMEYTLSAGQSEEISIDPQLELMRSNVSNSTVQIIGSNGITVQAISYRNNSVQTALVISADKLGTSYLIPPIPNIPGTTNINVTIYVTERAPFRLIIVNANTPNTVTVGGQTPQKLQLGPNQTAQIWLQQQDQLRTVTAQQPVAVLFGHSCAMRVNCTCSLLYTPLSPTQTETQNFFVPPVLSASADNTVLILSDQNSIACFNPDSPQVQSASTVILYRPGLLLPLVAESDFASCFIANSISSMQTFAVIIVDQAYTDGVHVGNSPLPNPQWETLTGTNYVWTQFEIVSDVNVFWHDSYTMAVYFGGTMGSALFGNPASVISRSSDYRGCVLTPAVLLIGEQAIGWPDSVQYCKNRTLELISIPETQLQTQIYNILTKTSDEQDFWIGMRRSSQTGEWYWLSGDPVTDTDWGAGAPSDVDAGQCVIMSPNSSTIFSWQDEDCCQAAYPVCYREPVLLPM